MRAQVSIEYLVLATVALTISAVVVLIALNVFGGQAPQVGLNNCRAAAQLCKNQLFLNSSAQCPQCDTPCVDSAGKEVVTGALGCCKSGQPENIYSGFTGACFFGPDLVAVPGSISLSYTNPQASFLVAVTARVNNSGKASSPQAQAKLSVKQSGGSWADVSTTTIPLLAVGANTEVTLSWTPTNYSAWDIRVSADSANEITEEFENNNDATTTLTNTDDILRLLTQSSGHSWNIVGDDVGLAARWQGREPRLSLAACESGKNYWVRFWVNTLTLPEPGEAGVTKKLRIASSTTQPIPQNFVDKSVSLDWNSDSFNISYLGEYGPSGVDGIFFTYYEELTDPAGKKNETTRYTFKICTLGGSAKGYGGGGGTGGLGSQCPQIPCPSGSICVNGYCAI